MKLKKINYYQVDFIFIDFMANSLQAYLSNEGAICEKNFELVPYILVIF